MECLADSCRRLNTKLITLQDCVAAYIYEAGSALSSSQSTTSVSMYLIKSFTSRRGYSDPIGSPASSQMSREKATRISWIHDTVSFLYGRRGYQIPGVFTRCGERAPPRFGQTVVPPFWRACPFGYFYRTRSIGISDSSRIVTALFLNSVPSLFL